MPARVLIAKPGLDGHDRGAKVVARALRDGGFEVIYAGIRQSVEVIAQTALQEDVDVVGLSLLSGAHVGLARKTIAALAAVGCADVKVIIGGVIPESDHKVLEEMGIAAIFPTGTTTKELVAGVRKVVESS
jgi:methylmalonyl-CoA mutase, C-terminal domain